MVITPVEELLMAGSTGYGTTSCVMVVKTIPVSAEVWLARVLPPVVVGISRS